jgi:hypothetical protein
LSGCCACCLKQGCMLTEDHLDVGGIEPPEDVGSRCERALGATSDRRSRSACGDGHR